MSYAALLDGEHKGMEFKVEGKDVDSDGIYEGHLTGNSYNRAESQPGSHGPYIILVRETENIRFVPDRKVS